MMKLWVIGLVVFCALLGAVGQLFLKLGSSTATANIFAWILNWKLVVGVMLYAVSAIIFIFALKQGDLSVLYPIIATSYVWVTILSIFVLGESVGTLNWLGIALIIAGVVFVVIK